ncbi:hypothetical protein LZZ90_05215 [Flavobacterium sp. SM15]|uniref:hypothetical protein n=1 Tax=Flavobacterium sp. SM15 TaxID=2908005 RepID=UPI001EDC2907|nr:hypothetical protein [Flavobacterium sp. SM15]MCG2610899.1 hypothetical protein [Flavobacterium sp. SM15]
MRKSILTLTCALVLLSCSIQGLTNDYSKLNQTEKTKIVALENFEKVDPEHVYKINANQLKQELSKHPKSLVYIFKNGCTSDLCKPMFVYENFANKNGYKLFLVMNGYANLNETLEQRINFKSPLFSIDNEYYKSKYRNTYMRYFENDLQGKPIDAAEGKYLGNLFFFKGNQLEKIERELPKS